MRSSRAPDTKQVTSAAQQASSPYNTSSSSSSHIGRRLSKRLDNPSPVIRTSQQRNSADSSQLLDWQAQAQNSRSHLPSPQERAEDDNLDPYLEQQESPRTAVQGPGQHSVTIRPVHGDSPPPPFPTSEERQPYQTHSQQHSLGHSQQPQFEHPSQPSQPTSLHSQPSYTNTDSLGLIHGHYRQQNPETVSQLSYDSPVDQNQRDDQPRPASVHSNGNSPTAGNTSLRQDYPNRTTSIPTSRPLSQYTQYPQMAPPPAGATQPNRRPNDSKQTLQAGQNPPDSRDGPPPGYQRGFPGGGATPTSGPGQSPIPPTVGGNQGPNYRGGPPQREQYGAPGVGEQGRSTPPPAPERDVNDAYKELLQKYKKVKGLYFDKTAQVEQLQNTLANQRLSQSRTSLDDSEYMTRFQRLDGATTNLAFNIRKDWRTIPNWLAPYVNQDALKVGKQEMTAVGRACISRFLVDEIFNRSFHPGLELELSTSLKNIEQNIRRFSPAINSQEESDALTGKVVQWRLATLEGLKDVLSSPESGECKIQFAKVAATNLTANLINYLGEPVPPGIEDSANMIIELAVSIAANLPLESRDISIIYPMPGDLLQPLFMKTEAGVPLLENPGLDTSSEMETSSTGSNDKDEPQKEAEKESNKIRKEKPKSGMLQAMMGGGSSSGAGSKSKPAGSAPSGAQDVGENKPKEETMQKVRFAGFVGVEVRGRQMLVKAPVWTV